MEYAGNYTGRVVAVDDENQDGRVKVYVPAWDGDTYDIEQLPWARYIAPLSGSTTDYPRGPDGASTRSVIGYGLWAIPKVGAFVVCTYLDGDTSQRYYFGGIHQPLTNRSMPRGRNYDANGNHGPLSDLHDPQGNYSTIEPAMSNLMEQFNGDLNNPVAVTRGAFEKAVAQGTIDKDGSDGYTSNPADPSYLDSQTYCLTTPGGHSVILQDDPRWCRMRLVTTAGRQIILDDTNERIYISTAKGHSWLEMDDDGHIHVYAAQSLSIRAGDTLNLYADNQINLETKAINLKATDGAIKLHSGGNIDLKSNQSVRINGCSSTDISSEGVLRLSSDGSTHLKAKAAIVLKGATTDIGSEGLLVLAGSKISARTSSATPSTAQCPDNATGVTLLPKHEPWDARPTSKMKRNKNWRP